MMASRFTSNKSPARKSSSKSEIGLAAVYAAIAIIPLLGIVGLGIDALNLQNIKQELQDSVDSAALGAGYRLEQIGASSGAVPVAAVEDLAEALLVANINKKISTAKHGALVGKSAVISIIGNTKKLDVTANYKTETYLMWLLGSKSVTVSAKAKAQYSINSKPRFYVVLADRSSSMDDKIPKTSAAGSGGIKKINVLKSTLKSIIDVFPAEWGMALIAFGDGASIKKNMNLNINKTQYKNAVNDLSPNGGTNFVDAFAKATVGSTNPIERAIALGMPSDGDGLHILLITDGNPHSRPGWLDKGWFLNKFKPSDPAYSEYQKYFPGCSNVTAADDHVNSNSKARFLESIKRADTIRELYPKAVVDSLVIGNKGEPVKASDYTCNSSHLTGCKNKFPFDNFFQGVSDNEDVMDAKDKLAWPYLLSRMTLARNNNNALVKEKFLKDFPAPPDYPTGLPGFIFPESPCTRSYDALESMGKVAGRLYLSQTADDVKEDIKEYFNDESKQLELVE